MALVGSGRAMVPLAVSSTGDSLGSRRLSGSTKLHMRFEKDDVKSVVPSADLRVVSVKDAKGYIHKRIPLYALKERASVMSLISLGRWRSIWIACRSHDAD
jgi:hypothetical protein